MSGAHEAVRAARARRPCRLSEDVPRAALAWAALRPWWACVLRGWRAIEVLPPGMACCVSAVSWRGHQRLCAQCGVGLATAVQTNSACCGEEVRAGRLRTQRSLVRCCHGVSGQFVAAWAQVSLAAPGEACPSRQPLREGNRTQLA